MPKMVVVMLIYCAMTPLGILLGMTACLLGGPAGTLITTTTQAFGAGSLRASVVQEGNQSRRNAFCEVYSIEQCRTVQYSTL